MTEEDQFIKLPIRDTFLQVLQIMVDRYKYFLKFSIPLIILFVLIFFFKGWLGLDKQDSISLSFFIVMIVSMLVLSMVIVAFHRTFIMDISDLEQTRIFRIGGREWRFIGWYFVISFCAGLIFMGFGLVMSILGNTINPENLRYLVFVLMVPLNYLISRWLLVLPAASVDDEEASISFAWNLSEGNGWRLTLLIFVIPILLSLVNAFIGSFDFIIFNIISSALALISAVIGIGVISLSYSYLRLNSDSSVM